jgi:ribonuclease E
MEEEEGLTAPAAAPAPALPGAAEEPRTPRRRRRRRRRGRRPDEAGIPAADQAGPPGAADDRASSAGAEQEGAPTAKAPTGPITMDGDRSSSQEGAGKDRSRSRPGRRGGYQPSQEVTETAAADVVETVERGPGAASQSAPKKRRRRRRKSGAAAPAAAGVAALKAHPEASAAADASHSPAPESRAPSAGRPKRSLYRAARKKIAPGAARVAADGDEGGE